MKLARPHCICKVLLASGLAINSLYKLLIPCSHVLAPGSPAHPPTHLYCVQAHSCVHALAPPHTQFSRSHVLVTRNVCSVSERGVGMLVSTHKGTTNADSRTFETYYTCGIVKFSPV